MTIDWHHMGKAPQTKPLLLLCKTQYSDFTLIEGFWRVNKYQGANPWNTEPGWWEPWTGDLEIESTERLHPIAWTDPWQLGKLEAIHTFDKELQE